MPLLKIPRHVAYKLTLIAMIALFASSCSSLRYYAHVAHGQMQLVSEREPLDKVIAASTTDAKLATRLNLTKQAREFASKQLRLPDNRSYTTYVELHRPYVVWNVFAAPPYSIEPVLHCFPIAGCVPYRGYFNEEMANAEGKRLREQGNDVFIGGVPAYSTLGWFDDSILSSMLRWDDDELIGTIFHELAHQLIYAKDDSAFNESFASFVQQQGLREWRASRGLPSQDERDHAIDDGFVKLVLDLRERLKQVYTSKIAPSEMEAAKQQAFDDFRERYRQWRDTNYPNDHTRDAFVAAPLNNARLLPFGLYDQWVPAFAALFAQCGDQWPMFYDRVRQLAKLDQLQRKIALDALIAAHVTSSPIK